MPSPSRAAPWSIAPVAGLLVVALALRPQLSAIGPLADSIISDLGTTHAYVGLLTTIPVLCMGVFAVLGPPLAARVGVRAGIAAGVTTLLLFGALRAVLPGAEVLLLLTLGVGIGTGAVGPILPMFVRGRLPAHAVAGTAAYAAGTTLGATAAAALVVPLQRATGGWREALLAITALSAVSLVAWVVVARRLPTVAGPEVPPGAAALPRFPWRRPIAWVIGLLFGLQSWLYYGTTAWITKVYLERGWDAAAAAGLLTLVNGASLAAIVLVPWLSARGGSRRTLLLLATGMILVGVGGVLLVPGPAVAWTVVAGLGLGMAFTLSLTLPVDISDQPREVGGAAALMLLVGYLLASLAPATLGAVRDATGGFEPSLWLMLAIGVAMGAVVLFLSPRRLHGTPAEAVAAVPRG